MRVVGFLGVAVVLALASTSTLAFQEQGAPPAASAPSEAAAPASKAPASEFSGTTEDKSAGTEVRIPGLGKLGVLPKMDFGLELLYGASEGKQQQEIEEPSAPSDDLRVRGTVKHNF